MFAVSERYPDLKANSDFQQLMGELENTANKIAFSRQNYNQTVQTYNASIQTFPNSLVAGSRFTKRDYLKVPTADTQPVHVDFSDLNK